MMLAPAPLAIIVGSRAWVTLTRPLILVSIMVCQSASSTPVPGLATAPVPGIVQQALHRFGGLRQPIHHRLHGIGIAHIEHRIVHRNLAGEFIDQLFEPIFTPSCDHHSPPGGKTTRRSATKPEVAPVIKTISAISNSLVFIPFNTGSSVSLPE